MEDSVRHAPDEDWCADTLIKLTRGVTAYRLEMPESCDDAAQDHTPLVLCLHDFCNASYMEGYELPADEDKNGPTCSGPGVGLLREWKVALAYFLKYKRIGLKEAYLDLKQTRGKLDFDLQSPQTALLSKLMATSREGANARGSGVTHHGLTKRDGKGL